MPEGRAQVKRGWGAGKERRSEPPPGWARWPETRDLGDRLRTATCEQTTGREDLAGEQTAREEKEARVARRLGEDPRLEVVAQRPAGCLEVQLGRRQSERTQDASSGWTKPSADGPTLGGCQTRAEWDAQSEGRVEERITQLRTQAEATRRTEARVGQEGVSQERSGGSETRSGRRGQHMRPGVDSETAEDDPGAPTARAQGGQPRD